MSGRGTARRGVKKCTRDLTKDQFGFNIVNNDVEGEITNMKASEDAPIGDRRPWFEYLGEEDMAFIKRFLLASGSLKELAHAYGISYPTIRLRLDRLIEKIKVLDDMEIVGEFERRLRAIYADGRIDIATMKTLLEAHMLEIEGGSK